MELHRSRDEHDIEPAGDFLTVLAHHEIWHLYVDWTRMCQIFFEIQKSGLASALCFARPFAMDYVHLGFLLLRWLRWPLEWFNYEEAGF